MGRIAFLVLAAFVVGLGSGFLLGLRRGPMPAPPGEGQPSPREERPAAADAGESPAPPPLEKAALSPAEEGTAVPVPSIEKGKGVITGRVLTERAEPLPGVLVRANRVRETGEV